MKIKRIIFLTLHPFDSRDVKRFGIKFFQKEGLEVLSLCVGDIVIKKNYIYDKNRENSNIIKQIMISNYSLLNNFFKGLNRETTIIISTIDIGTSSIKLFYNLRNFKIFFLYTNIIPLSGAKLKVKDYIQRFPLKKTVEKILKKIIHLYYFKNFKINYIILGGKKSDVVLREFYSPKVIRIWTHTLDYNLYLEYEKKNNKNVNRIVKEKYCVFLDEFLPYHPDYKISGKSKDFEKIGDLYYQKMNKFFDNIEKLMDIKVVIALHPRTDLSLVKNKWHNRHIFLKKTLPLVKNCEFCMVHASTSINFAILYKKPILFLTFKELEPLYGYFIDKFCISLGCNKIFVENFNLNEVKFKLKNVLKNYEQYKENFIKRKGTPEKNTWEIFLSYLRS